MANLILGITARYAYAYYHYAQRHNKAYHAHCRYAECHYTECCYTGQPYIDNVITQQFKNAFSTLVSVD
jgi:hypothetical protein